MVICDEDGSVLLETFEADTVELKAFPNLFLSRESCIKSGIDFASHHYDVHRYYELYPLNDGTELIADIRAL